MTVKDHTPEFRRKIERAVNAGLGSASMIASEHAKSSMPGGGALARKPSPKARLRYIPSHAGRPPGVRTGLLRNSVTYAQLGNMVWGYGTRVFYGRIHELGLGNHPPRPFLRPAYERNREAIQAAFSRTAAREMERGAIRG
jgi:hypothetical protein